MNATAKAEALRLKIDQRFRSGNSVPVERTYITAEEWAALRTPRPESDARDAARPDRPPGYTDSEWEAWMRGWDSHAQAVYGARIGLAALTQPEATR